MRKQHRMHKKFQLLMTELFDLEEPDTNLERQVELCRDILKLNKEIHSLSRYRRGRVLLAFGNALRLLAREWGNAETGRMLEQVITCYDQALACFDRTTELNEYALTQQNKANALRLLAERRGDEQGVRMLEQAISCYDQALASFNRTTRAEAYAVTLMNKANTLRDLAGRCGGEQGVQMLEQAITCCDIALETFGPNSIADEYAKIQQIKGNVLALLGEWQEGVALLKQAITCYDIALEIFEHRGSLDEYAMTLQNKGNALLILGARYTEAETKRMNEQAIDCFDQALAAFDRTVPAYLFALTQQNKGNALQLQAGLLKGVEGIESLEQAISCYDQALTCFDRDNMDPLYAITLQNKGNALLSLAERYEGVKGVKLLEQAITCYDQALAYFNRDGMALDYARTQQQKGNALQRLGNRRQQAEAVRLLDKAITCFDVALEIREQTYMPHFNAETQQDKGLALMLLAQLRGRQESRDLLEQAITCFDIALEIFDHNSTNYVITLTNKGSAYQKLAENFGRDGAVHFLNHAFDCFDLALKACDHSSMGTLNAQTQLSKGVALARLAEWQGKAEAVRLLGQAVVCFDVALEIFDRSSMAPDHAIAQQNKGNVLHSLAELHEGNEAVQLLEQAIKCYRIALELSPQAIEPREHRTRAYLLARTCVALGLMMPDPASALSEAWDVVASGLEAVHILELLAPSLEFRQQEWSQNASFYAIAGIIQALRGAADEAVALLEAGRARGLAEAQNRRFIDLSILSAAERNEYEAAVNTVLELEARGRQGGDFRHSVALLTEAATANTTLAKVVERLQKTHSNFLPETHLNKEDLAAVLHREEALIYLVPENSGTLMVIVSHAEQLQAELLRELTSSQLSELVVQTDERSNTLLGYLPAIAGWGTTPLDEALDTLLPILGKQLMRRVVQRVRELGAHHAILVPGGSLAMLPLHAATYAPLTPEDAPTAPHGQRYACDDVIITYTPSGAAYLSAHSVGEHISSLRQGFVVGNPKLTPRSDPRWEPGMRGYLTHAIEEAKSITHLMETAGMKVTCKIDAEATWKAIVDGLRDAEVVHLAMHAMFDSFDPLDSALLVSPQAKLFLRDLLDPRLIAPTHLRLAVLSACQSGLGDFYRLSEEAMGLFGALLAGGTAGVVGSLWPVYDCSTKLLMEAFTQRYLLESQEPRVALRNAIRWLRDLPEEAPVGYNETTLETKQKAQYSEEVTNQRPSAQQQWEKECEREPDMVQLISYRSAHEKESGDATARHIPLDHPAHWAAFIYYGY